MENPRGSDHRYIALVSTIQEKKDSVILGMDCSWPNGASKTPQSSPTVQSRRDLSGCKRGCKAIIGLVLPICKRMEVRLSGDGYVRDLLAGLPIYKSAFSLAYGRCLPVRMVSFVI